MALERGFRTPDGLVLCYPALNLSRANFNPSYLLSLDDPILSYPFLKMCQDSYMGNLPKHIEPSTCPYISPGIVSDEILQKFPKTRFLIPANDPIRDDSFKFLLRLANLGVDVQAKEFSLMPHGFLNYNFPIFGMPEESMRGIKQGSEWLAEMLKDEQMET
mmetsp:Transcript_39158/g.37495  ORF Transcript_39158/g.37495 Transcript_39158/m.37495 type:complete len:161 (-) Transcript_39158:45-527(-)